MRARKRLLRAARSKARVISFFCFCAPFRLDLAMLIAERGLETVNYAIHIAKQKDAMRKRMILN